MPPLVHVRTLFFCLFLLSLPPSSSSRRLFSHLFHPLSSLFLCLLSVSVSLSRSLCLSPCAVALVLCLVCVCVGGWEGREGWWWLVCVCCVCLFVWRGGGKEGPCVDSKRPPCLDSKRPRVHRHHAHMWCTFETSPCVPAPRVRLVPAHTGTF